MSMKFFTGSHTARGGWVVGGKQLYTVKQGPNSTALLTGATRVDLGQLY
jgi:hypothetical protein